MLYMIAVQGLSKVRKHPYKTKAVWQILETSCGWSGKPVKTMLRPTLSWQPYWIQLRFFYWWEGRCVIYQTSRAFNQENNCLPCVNVTTFVIMFKQCFILTSNMKNCVIQSRTEDVEIILVSAATPDKERFQIPVKWKEWAEEGVIVTLNKSFWWLEKNISEQWGQQTKSTAWTQSYVNMKPIIVFLVKFSTRLMGNRHTHTPFPNWQTEVKSKVGSLQMAAMSAMWRNMFSLLPHLVYKIV